MRQMIEIALASKMKTPQAFMRRPGKYPHRGVYRRFEGLPYH